MFEALLAILLLLLVVVSVPIDAKFWIDTTSEKKGSVTIGWLFGLIHFSVPIGGEEKKKKKKAKEKKAKEEKPKKEKKKKSKGGLCAFRLIRNEDLRRRFFRFIKDLFGSLTIGELKLSVWFGFSDPADTGMATGWLWPISFWLSKVKRADIAITPVFHQETFDAKGAGEVRFVPIVALYSVAAMALSPALLRGLWSCR